MNMKPNTKIGFIGAGNMAEAFISGLSKRMDSSQIQMSDPDNQRLSYLKNKYQVACVTHNSELFQNNDIVILAVKPQVMKAVLQEIKPSQMNTHRLIVSIAAGIQLQTITQILYEDLAEKSHHLLPIIRVMPNTPALIQCGMSAYCGNMYATENDMQIVQEILNSMGRVIAVDESQINAITAISGSGPAYTFYFVESMIEAAKKLGFSEEHARMLVLQTAEGAMQMLKQPDACPIKLRQQVTSKGGTTEAAIGVMDSHSVKNVIINAMMQAEKRAKELSQI
jgi:pyrroline-5-carboxylate reductase